MATSEDPPSSREPAPGPDEQQTPPPGDASTDASNPLRWQNILAAVAAAAGSAAWVSAVGSGVMGARLENAGMPVGSTLALMPAEQRFAIGASYLIAPLFVGLVGFLADVALTTQMAREKEKEKEKERRADGSSAASTGPRLLVWCRDRFREATLKGSFRRRLAAVMIALGGVVGAWLLEPPSPLLYLLQIGAIIIALTLVYVFGPGEGETPSERGAVFLLALVLAGVLAFAFEQRRDPKFDFTAVRFKDSGGPPLAGYYVTTTSNAVLLITLGWHSEKDVYARSFFLGRITAVSTDDIERLWIGPNAVKYALDDYCEQKRIALNAVVFEPAD
jgi:hypothetical protein